MEHTIARASIGTLSLDLRPDGTFQGDMAVSDTAVGTTSRYASDDGEDHRSETTSEQALRIEGTWAQEDAHTRLTLARIIYPTAPDNPTVLPDLVSLRCWTATGPGLPVPVLACQPDGNHPRALIDSLTLPAEPPTEDYGPGIEDRARATPWLLLGQDPGIAIDWSEQDRRDTQIKLTALPAPNSPP